MGFLVNKCAPKILSKVPQTWNACNSRFGMPLPSTIIKGRKQYVHLLFTVKHILYIHTYMYILTYIHTYIHTTYKHIYIPRQIHVYIDTCTYVHVYIVFMYGLSVCSGLVCFETVVGAVQRTTLGTFFVGGISYHHMIVVGLL